MPVILLVFFAGGLYWLSQRESTGENQPLDVATETVKDVVSGMQAKFSTPYDELIANSEDANGLQRGLLWNLLYTESHFRQDIITGQKRSSVGAMGIAQFMPATAAQLGIDPLDPQQAIPAAARYLAGLIRQTGSVDAGVAAYNWGIGNVLRKGLAKAPQETIDYVAAITGGDITKEA